MLKPISPSTVSNLYTLFKQGQYPHFFRHFPTTITPELFLQIFNTILSFDIVLNNQTLGIVTATINTNTKNIDLGILLYNEHQHKGLAFKTLYNYINILFKHKAHKVICNISSSDKRSIELVEKAGFIKEATLRDFAFYNNHYHDDLRYILTPKRFKRLYSKEKPQ